MNISNSAYMSGSGFSRSFSRVVTSCTTSRASHLLSGISYSKRNCPLTSASLAARRPALAHISIAPRDSVISHVRAFDRPSWSMDSLFAAPPRALTDAEIGRLLSLAQLHVPPAEMEALKSHMQRLLGFLESVKAADAGGCSPMHALPCKPIQATLDACDVASDDADLEVVLSNASWVQESMFAVPKAIEE